MSKRIALVEWNWTGHHPTWFNHYILALEELGHEVLALCPHPEDARALAAETRAESGVQGCNKPATVFGRLEVPAMRFKWLRPGRIALIDRTIRHFTGIEKQASALAAKSGGAVDAVFHACVYDKDFEWFPYARPFLKLPWTGLYLHAMSYRMPGHPRPGARRPPRPDRIFRGQLCRSVGILDEGIIDRVAKHLGKPVVALPDLPDNRQQEQTDDGILGEDLARFANGRPVVGLFGHLMKSKGLFTLLEAAAMPGARDVCFALGGQILWPFDQDEAEWIRLTIRNNSNVWSHLERIPTEPALARLIMECDMLAAAYHDFPHSSGILAKAAAIGKPVIVSDGYLMAERVRRFGTGKTVPQGDAAALLDAVLDITRDPSGWTERCRPGWSGYLREHSYQRFKDGIAEMLAPFETTGR